MAKYKITYEDGSTEIIDDSVPMGKVASEAVKSAVTPIIPAPLKGAPQTKVSDIAESPYAQQFALGMGQTGTMGYMLPALKQMGAEIPEPKTTGEKVARYAGYGVGMIPSTAGMIMGPTALGASTIGRIATGAVTGATSGYMYNPSEEKILPRDARERKVGAAVGGALGASFGLLGDLITKATSGKEVAKKVRSGIMDYKTKTGQHVDDTIQKLSAGGEKTIDVSDDMLYMKNAIQNADVNPGLAGDVKSVIRQIKEPQTAKMLNNLLDNPENAKNLTLAQVQEIKKAITRSPRIANKLKQGKFANWTQGEQELLDLSDGIRTKELEAFPELAKTFKDYHRTVTNYREIKGLLKKGRLIKNMKQNWNDPELKSTIENLMSPELIREVGGYQNATKLLSILGIIGKGLAYGAAGGYAARYVIGRTSSKNVPFTNQE